MARLKYYLDTRRTRLDGTHTLTLSLSHCRQTGKIYLDKYYTLQQWEGIVGEIETMPRSRWNAETVEIYFLKASYDSALDRIRRDRDIMEMSACELRDELERQIKGQARVDRIRPKKTRLLERFRRYAEKADTDGTRKIYLRTSKKILEYDPDAERLGLDDIDREWMDGFDMFLKQTTSANIRNLYFRNIRAVFNDAIADGVTANYPFKTFKMPKLEPTRKRALTLEQLRALRKAPCDEFQAEYRDLFLLSVYLIGISPVDLLCAKKEEIVNGRLEYRRRKTHKPYSIKIEPEAQGIIDRYSGKDWLLSPLDRYKDYKDYLSHMNRALKTIGKTCAKNGLRREGEAICSDLSAYWSRHTWTTLSAQLDIPLEIAARALGHSWIDNVVTSIYIQFDTRKVDAANRKVIDAIIKENYEI